MYFEILTTCVLVRICYNIFGVYGAIAIWRQILAYSLTVHSTEHSLVGPLKITHVNWRLALWFNQRLAHFCATKNIFILRLAAYF